MSRNEGPVSPIVADLAVGLVAVAAIAGSLQVAFTAQSTWLGGAVLAYLTLAAVIYRFWPRDRAGFGWPNRITLARTALVAVLAGALTAPGFMAERGLAISLLALVAVALDGLDGWLARALDGATRFGARFDMEIDALLILVLSVCVYATGRAGAWVLAIGAMRYGFIALGWALPWWRRELPESTWRKVVCVIQAVVLALLLLPWLQPPLTQWIAAACLALLAHSFARDAAWLVRARELPMDTETRRNPR